MHMHLYFETAGIVNYSLNNFSGTHGMSPSDTLCCLVLPESLGGGQVLLPSHRGEKLSVSLQVSVTVESIYWFACHSIGDAFSPESALSLLYVMSGNA